MDTGTAVRDVGVIYLCRFAEGERPVRRFLESYLAHPAGRDHDLIVVFKGFPDQQSLARANALFAGVPINAVEVDDLGFDVGAYVKAARLVLNRRLLFLNTFSQILADNWLEHFDRALDRPEVGVVGATGSWAANTAGPEATVVFLVRRMLGLPATLHQSVEHVQPEGGTAHAGRASAARLYLSAPFDYAVRYYRFGRFPNPHLRTNAFMMDRARFLALDLPSFKSKSDTYGFESGRRSMTKQILTQGLQPVVIDRQGRVYRIPEWRSSSTFRAGEQENLIVADNRTVNFSEAGPAHRQYLEKLSWVHPWNWDDDRPPPPRFT
ncbi:hypothetical protein JQ594_23300 [Bradyrhizobium manausense]|uniref:hypothetical protein n=1 Tax=Bradyrhizobium manausense TaxID=989370 RepID=UPI001BAC14D7|nr:hypothetical protein [Bradyrhizobium manausense]MBR0688870.1 hypothetical protein [Bradyrhizobium manausense]